MNPTEHNKAVPDWATDAAHEIGMAQRAYINAEPFAAKPVDIAAIIRKHAPSVPAVGGGGSDHAAFGCTDGRVSCVDARYGAVPHRHKQPAVAISCRHLLPSPRHARKPALHRPRKDAVGEHDAGGEGGALIKRVKLLTLLACLEQFSSEEYEECARNLLRVIEGEPK